MSSIGGSANGSSRAPSTAGHEGTQVQERAEPREAGLSSLAPRERQVTWDHSPAGPRHPVPPAQGPPSHLHLSAVQTGHLGPKALLPKGVSAKPGARLKCLPCLTAVLAVGAKPRPRATGDSNASSTFTQSRRTGPGLPPTVQRRPWAGLFSPRVSPTHFWGPFWMQNSMMQTCLTSGSSVRPQKAESLGPLCVGKVTAIHGV